MEPFAITYDYRCPFARIAAEHVVGGLRAGAGWDVRFMPFSLSQAKLAAGQTGWDATRDSGLLALELGVAVRDTQPERFPDAHLALFALRHDQGKSLSDEALLAKALGSAGVDVEAAFAEVASGRTLEAVRRDHEEGVASHDVWGVPTFIAGGSAAFVRLMDHPESDNAARAAVERLVDLLAGWPSLNEFKHTTLNR